MTEVIVVLLSAIVAGIIQAVTGFGSGVFMMMFFPMILPVLNASALSAAISLAASLGMTVTYRKYIHKEIILFPGICYIAASSAAISFAAKLPTELLMKIFGAFLIVLAVYFLVFSKKIHVKANMPTAGVCATLSGAVSGLFGIGGPPMVIYYLAALPRKEEYLGTIQAFFFITGLYTFGFRVAKGIYTWKLVPLTIIGMCAIMLGKKIGNMIIDRINADTMRKLVYVFLGFTGVLNLIK